VPCGLPDISAELLAIKVASVSPGIAVDTPE
jgi:hypothetical protein